MPTRRGVLGATAGGVVAGLAGCTGILSSNGDGSDGSGGSLDAALLAEPSLQAVASEPDWEEQFARAGMTYCDCATLRGRDAPVADWATQRGALEVLPGVANVDAVESVDQTAAGSYQTSFGESQILGGFSGYARGSIDATAFQDSNGGGDSDERIGGHAVFSAENDAILGVSETGIGSARVRNYLNADLEEATPTEYDQFETALLERTIERAGDPPEPADWVTDALDRLDPYQYATHTLTIYADTTASNAIATGYDVGGEETTVEVLVAAPTTDAFDEAWDREAVERQFRRWSDADLSFDLGDRIGVASATISTQQTVLANENYLG
jgi:hypothetical protein